MAGRFDFDSPGAAFVDTMAKVLAERKAEERQAMLDRLTQSAEQRATRAEERAVEQQKADTAWRQSQTEHQNWQRENQDFETLSRFIDPEKPLAEQNLTPQQLELLTKRGAVRKRPKTVAGVNTSEEFMPAEAGVEMEGMPTSMVPEDQRPAPAPPVMEDFFAGTAEYQEKQRTKARHGELIVSLLTSDNPEDKKDGQYLARLAQGNGGIIPEKALAETLEQNVPVMVYDQEGQTWNELEGGADPRAKIHIGSRAPRPPAAPRQKYIGANPEGHPIFERPDGTIFVDSSVQLGGKNYTERPLGAPNAAMEEHAMSVMAMANPTPEAVEMFKHTANAIIEQSNLTPKARRLAQTYLINPDSVAASIDRENLTEQDKQQFLRLISLIGMDRYREHLKSKK